MRTARECGVYCGEQVLAVALELSSAKWRLCFGANGRSRQVTVEPGNAEEWESAVARAKAKLGLPAAAPVESCYEAGRDGFWIHRWLLQRDVHNVVVDSASIEVSRRSRQAKTDRIDAEKLLALLQRWYGGDHAALRAVRVPTVEEEDWRTLHRERDTVVRQRTQCTNRLKGLLAAHGIRVQGPPSAWSGHLDALRTGDGRPLPPHLRARLERLAGQHQQLCAALRALEGEQRQRVAEAAGRGPAPLVELLMTLKGVGLQSAWVLVYELFAWRRFANRRELAACVGVIPTPFDSGKSSREQGISKSGSRRVRHVLIELAWSWLRHQPDSELSQWWRQRFADGRRSRKVGIVALARKLLIALWTMTENGTLPSGARMKTAAR